MAKIVDAEAPLEVSSNNFGYHLPDEHIGECWGISAHPNGKSEILNGPYAGQTLDQVWNDHRELFGEFPSKDFL